MLADVTVHRLLQDAALCIAPSLSVCLSVLSVCLSLCLSWVWSWLDIEKLCKGWAWNGRLSMALITRRQSGRSTSLHRMCVVSSHDNDVCGGTLNLTQLQRHDDDADVNKRVSCVQCQCSGCTARRAVDMWHDYNSEKCVPANWTQQ